MDDYTRAVAAILKAAQQQPGQPTYKMLREEAPKPKGPRLQSRFLTKARVADLTGRRHGVVRGVLQDGWLVVRWDDELGNQRVHEAGLMLRFTTQSVGFVPKGKRDEVAVEDEGEEL